jgi:putative acetyltransferase
MHVEIRIEVPADIAEIKALTTAAFLSVSYSSHTEQLIIDALRNSGNLTLSLVAETNGKTVGHVAVSPVSISDGSQGWYGLGPVSVAPEYQGIGIGSQLIRQALTRLQEMSASGCVVLGNPNFYGRFGFKPEPSLVLADVPPEYFQAIAFDAPMPNGFVSFHESFDAQS